MILAINDRIDKNALNTRYDKFNAYTYIFHHLNDISTVRPIAIDDLIVSFSHHAVARICDPLCRFYVLYYNIICIKSSITVELIHECTFQVFELRIETNTMK